jgi:transcription-repair coupling factor (superfamily II helicase)
LPTELSVLQKYASASAAKPKLNKLGTQEWAGTKRKVKSAVDEVAEDLVQLYSARREKKGHRFGPDTEWQKEFEEMFPYEETDDQLTAIEETKKDMESDRIMDRLICGDVGYGKTEIAVRAAFKAVQEGMQVAVLVPTTILAQQHYNTFCERMRRYPVTVGMLSRFRTSAEQKQTIKEVSQGLCDIVVGTHRLLSKDVKFKNLGLLVVDEEQRFGVTHKEKIKKMKENVDVLTLSATPIPRTLHMSLVGIRDMTVLEEAPEGRVPIQTYVMEYDEEMVREAILRELSRKGQVYYVHNKVHDIEDVTFRLQKLVPEANIVYAHGQMKESELEKIMYDFINGEIDVLVSTTIIETGLDISNVNTIIIHDSDKMGLSQLYQLRGRVGRSGRTAYAFLMYKKDRMLREVAEKRLRAIKEYTDLGSGFRIAMRDLEIRGAGSVLGRAQHGHMQAVGYDLYCKLLNTAVKQVKGEPVKEERMVRVNLSADAFLLESYIINEEQKLEIYKKIAAIESTDDYDDVKEELVDRFGEIPAPAGNLLRVALIRSVAARIGVTEIVGHPGTIRFYMDPSAKVRGENIPLLLRNYRKNLSFSVKGFSNKGLPEFMYQYKAVGVTVRDEEILLSAVEELLVAMAKYLA